MVVEPKQDEPERFKRARGSRATDSTSKRDRQLRFDLNDQELASIHRMAAARHTAVSAFVREAALSADSAETMQERKQLIVELYSVRRLLAQMSNNVNQIARATNATGEWQAETAGTLEAARRTAQRIESLCDELSLS